METDPKFITDYINYVGTKRYRSGQQPITKHYKNIVTVVDGNRIVRILLTPNARQCFLFTFGGMVCDLDQWKYFRTCLRMVIEITHADMENYKAIKLQETSISPIY